MYLKTDEYTRNVIDAYSKKIWRKLEWRGFIRKDQTKNRIVNEFAKKVGNDAIIGVGDWSHKCRVQMKNNAPTIGIGLLRLLKRKFQDVYLIDEYKTSVTCSSCHGICNNPITTEKIISYTRDGSPLRRRVHKILRCTNDNCRIYWNRDVNGSSNIHLLGKSILNDDAIPECFRRSISLDVTSKS